MKAIFILFLPLILAGCLATPPIKTSSNLAGMTKLEGRSPALLHEMYGEYEVKDSRRNRTKADFVRLEERNGIPYFLTYKKGQEKPLDSIQLFECNGGDRKLEDGTTRTYLFCKNSFARTKTSPQINLLAYDRPTKVTDGAVIKTFEDMAVPLNHFHMVFNNGEYGFDTHFLLLKTNSVNGG